MSAAKVVLKALRRDVPTLVRKKDDTNKRIQLSKEIHQRNEEAEEERDKLDSKKGEFEAELQDSRPELDSLVDAKATLGKEASFGSVELNALRKDVQSLANKKSETEKRIQVSKEIHQRYEEAKEERDKLEGEIGEFGAGLQDSRPELSLLIETKTALNKDILSASVSLNALSKDVPGLKNKKVEVEGRIQLSKEIQQKYDEAKVEKDKLNNENKELEANVATGRQGLKDAKSNLMESQGMFKKHQGEKQVVDDKIEKLNIRKDKVNSLNTALEPVARERDGLVNQLDGLEAEVIEIRQDKEGLVKMERDKASLQQEYGSLRAKTKPIIDGLDKFVRLEESSEKAKADFDLVVRRIASRREGIQTMEVRAYSYKKAFEELAEAVIGQ